MQMPCEVKRHLIFSLFARVFSVTSRKPNIEQKTVECFVCNYKVIQITAQLIRVELLSLNILYWNIKFATPMPRKTIMFKTLKLLHSYLLESIGVYAVRKFLKSGHGPYLNQL